MSGKARKQTQVCRLQPAWQGPLRKGQSCPSPWVSLTLLSLSQGQRFHHYQVPRDKDAFPQPSRTLGPPRYRPAANGTQSSGRKVGLAVAAPQHRQAKGSPGPCELPGPGTPRLARNASPQADGRAAEEHSSPLGIPYSKLSQLKHLKARMGGGQWASSDSKRQAQAPRDCKDP